MDMKPAPSPTVSVILTTYNRREWLSEAIDSVLAQLHPASEVLVVDDGSQDGTVETLNAYGRRVAYVYTRHGGVSRARNIGLRFSHGTLVAYLDSDDLWHPQKLRRQVEHMQCYPDCQLCYTDEVWIRRGVRVNAAFKHRKHSGYIFERCLPLCLISPSSALMRRELLVEMGGFDETLPVCEDYDLWLRITARYPVHFLPDKLITKRGGHEDQLSRSRWGIDRYRVQSLQKLLTTGNLTTAQVRAVKRELRRKCHILELGCRKHGRGELAEYYGRLAIEI